MLTGLFSTRSRAEALVFPLQSKIRGLYPAEEWLDCIIIKKNATCPDFLGYTYSDIALAGIGSIGCFYFVCLIAILNYHYGEVFTALRNPHHDMTLTILELVRKPSTYQRSSRMQPCTKYIPGARI